MGRRMEVLAVLHGMVKANVMVFSYRGYGSSQGKPSEKGI
jgi:hypothetical protein